jgi:hypothetical protein
VGTNTQGERIAKAIWERYRLFLEEMLGDGKREGTIGPDIDAVIYSHILVASHTGMLVQWFVNGESLDVRAFVKTFREFLLNGITDKQE